MVTKKAESISLGALLRLWHDKYHKGKKMYYIADVGMATPVINLIREHGYEIGEDGFYYGIPAEETELIRTLSDRYGSQLVIVSSDDL